MVVQRPGRAVAAIVLGAVIYGGLMYAVLYRRRTTQIFARARPAASAEREFSSSPRARTLSKEAAPLLAVFFVLAIVFHDFALISGIPIGNGVAMMVIAERFRRWEAHHNLLLLREPRFRWKGQAGWGRGGA